MMLGLKAKIKTSICFTCNNTPHLSNKEVMQHFNPELKHPLGCELLQSFLHCYVGLLPRYGEQPEG